MKIRFITMFLLAGMLLGAGPLTAQEPRLAVLNMERLFDEYHKTLSANADLKKRFAGDDAQRQELRAQCEAAKERLEKLAAETRDKSLNDEARTRKRDEAEEAFLAFRETESKLADFEETYQKKIGSQLKAVHQQLVTEIRAVIADYARQHEIALVLDVSGKTLNSVETVVYAVPSLDLTETILTILNTPATKADASESEVHDADS